MICPPPLWTGSSEMTAFSLKLTLRIAGMEGGEGRGGNVEGGVGRYNRGNDVDEFI